MKNIRRLIAVMLSVIMMAGMCCFAAAQTEENGTARLLHKRLTALGLLKEGEFFLSGEAVSRKQLAKLAVEMYGEAGEDSADCPFTDVPAGDSYAPYIAKAYQLQLMVGYSNTEFKPDETVTVWQAAKVFAVLVGCSSVSNNIDYIKAANQLGLLKNVTATGAAVMPAQLLQIMWNAANADMLMIREMRGDYGYYSTGRGRTFLTERFGIETIEGVLDGTPYTSLMSSESACSSGWVTIAGKKLQSQVEDAESYLGYSVTGYYNEEDNTLLYLEPTRRNEAVVVTYRNIVKDSVTQNQFVYTEDEQTRQYTKKFDETVIFIYNGRQTSLSVDKLCPKVGEVTLIDNNGDGWIDVLSVMDYRVAVAGMVNIVSGVIADYLGGKALTADSSDSHYGVEIIRDGRRVTLGEIGVHDVILYAESEGGGVNKRTLLVSGGSVSGVVTAVSEDRVYVEGAEYETEDSLSAAVGETGTFFIDAYGRIVGKKSDKDIVYGYLYAMNQKGLGSVRLKIFTENSRWVELDMKDKFRFARDGEVSENYSSKKFYDTYKDKSQSELQQLITYRVNEDGKVCELSFARTVKAWSSDEDAAIDNQEFRLCREGSSVRYRSTTQHFEHDIQMNGSVKIFMLPASGDRDDFFVTNNSSLVADQAYNVKAYDCNLFGVPRACVITGYESSQGTTSDVMVFKNTINMLNSQGDTTRGIVGMYKGYEISVPLRDNSVDVSKLTFGSVFQFALNQNGDIFRITSRYTHNPNTESLTLPGSGIYANYGYFAATVFRVDYENKKVIMNQEGGKKVIMDLNSMLNMVYVCNGETQKIRQGSINDIREGMILFGVFRYNRATTVVVYE